MQMLVSLTVVETCGHAMIGKGILLNFWAYFQPLKKLATVSETLGS